MRLLFALIFTVFTINHALADAQYWQRSSVSDSAYQRGIQAQEDLNRDMASCIAQIKELQDLGQIYKGFPRDGKSVAELSIDNDETPPALGAVLNRQGQFNDFEGCMHLKGWGRVAFVPYKTINRAERTYNQNKDYVVTNFKTKEEVRREAKEIKECNDFCNLND